MLFLFSGEVQPAVSPNPRTEVDGPTRRGLPVFQAHAGERPPRHPPHGNAPCKKEIVITREWFASDSGWGAWKDWVKSARASSPRLALVSLHSSPSPARLADAICSLPVCAFKLCSIFGHLFAHAASVRIYACTSTTCWNGAGGTKCVHSVEKEKEGWNQYNSWFSLVLTYVKKSCLFSKD